MSTKLKKPQKPQKPRKPQKAQRVFMKDLELYSMPKLLHGHCIPENTPDFILLSGFGEVASNKEGSRFVLMNEDGLKYLAYSYSEDVVRKFNLEPLSFYVENPEDYGDNIPERNFLFDNGLLSEEHYSLSKEVLTLLVSTLSEYKDYTLGTGYEEYDPFTVTLVFARSEEEVRLEDEKAKAAYASELAEYEKNMEAYPRLLQEWKVEAAKAKVEEARAKLEEMQKS